MTLLETFIFLLQLWRPAFSSVRSFDYARALACATLTCVGQKKTLTNVWMAFRPSNQKPSSIYKFFSRMKWQVQDLFNPILKEAIPYFTGDHIVMGVDDSIFKKTGKRIPKTGYHRDPMSLPFWVNLIRGLRFLQYSLLIPQYLVNGAPCCSIPIRFIDAPPVRKPKKNAPQEEWDRYIQRKTEFNLSTIFVLEAQRIRRVLDKMGAAAKQLILVCDGSFCNRACLNAKWDRTSVVARGRKDAKLCFKSTSGRRKYDSNKFTPESVRQDENLAYNERQFYYGGEFRLIRYKELSNVLWQSVTKLMSLRLIILAPLPYVRGGKKNYRDPAYLFTNDLNTPVEILLQSYLDRVQIEYNFRDEKSVIGVAEAQVRNDRSVTKEPAFTVAVYSLLQLASLKTTVSSTQYNIAIPEWQNARKRPSCRVLVRTLTKQLWDNPILALRLNTTREMMMALFCKAA